MIIVTGSSRGLGKAIAERLIKKDHEVIGLSRSIKDLNLPSIQCDVSEYSSPTISSSESQVLFG